VAARAEAERRGLVERVDYLLPALLHAAVLDRKAGGEALSGG